MSTHDNKFIKQAKELGCLSVYSNVDSEFSELLNSAPEEIKQVMKQEFNDAAIQENFLTENSDY